ncbi:HigA family addiction module antitoxin [Pontibacter sp. G13]|uniref:HigA family addiction module antitoxin n=1 Tax=Pontibacter sp. G13 TaxID=3074898 RepID=UPI00288BD4E2|nr:HigA family addiction module antitoxin [Pontibacter sp. G13]WNJ19829.1 HigA family addiction module antitoxin [Pontibacter sp. G13]
MNRETMAQTDHLVPLHATHPGELLVDELEFREMPQAELARTIGMSRTQLNEILKGKRALTADLAILLEEVLGIDAQYWMSLQAQYDLDQARIRQSRRLDMLKRWKAHHTQIPVKLFKQAGIIQGDPALDIPALEAVYGVAFESISTYSAQPLEAIYYRQSPSLRKDHLAIVGWVKLVQYDAKRRTAHAFDIQHQGALIQALKQSFLHNQDLQSKIPEILEEHGIACVIQPVSAGIPVDGLAFWNEDGPAIALTFRHKRIDRFMFSLFHELGHIFLHMGQDRDRAFLDVGRTEGQAQALANRELEADAFAQNQLIPEDAWRRFRTEHPHRPTRESILQLAHANQVPPAVVVGRWKFETGNWKAKFGMSDKIG